MENKKPISFNDVTPPNSSTAKPVSGDEPPLTADASTEDTSTQPADSGANLPTETPASPTPPPEDSSEPAKTGAPSLSNAFELKETPELEKPKPGLPSPPPEPLLSAPKKSKKKLLLWIVVGIVVTVAIGVGTYFMLHKSPKASNNAATPTASNTTPSQTGATAANTDDASLNQDVKDLDTSIAQITQDQTSDDSALNDSQNQIQVPTN